MSDVAVKQPEAPSVELYRFEGTHKEMGRQQGARLKALIRDARRLLANSEEIELIKPPMMPAELFLLLGEIKTWIQYAPAIWKRYPRQFSRMKGIARGAGVTPAFITLLQSFEAEMNKLNYHTGGCTAMGLRGARTADGEPILFKNFDYPETFRSQYATRLDAPKGRYRSIHVTAAPLAGNHEGVNERGLAICYNYGYGRDKAGANVPITLLVQEALETCATTAEAVEQISAAKWCGGALLLLCDAGGDMRALEMSNRRAEQRMPADDAIINTNHYFTEPLKKIDIPEDAIYSKRNVAKLRGCCVRESTEARWARAYKLLAKLEKATEEDLAEIFSDHGPDDNPSDNTICRHNSYYNTTCSIILFPARRALKVAYDNPCQAKWETFALNGD